MKSLDSPTKEDPQIALLMATYQEQAEILMLLLATVANPDFDATRDKVILNLYNEKWEEVKNLVLLLWDRGINVYAEDKT